MSLTKTGYLSKGEKGGTLNLVIIYSEIAVFIKFLHIKTGQHILEYLKQLVATYGNTAYIKRQYFLSNIGAINTCNNLPLYCNFLSNSMYIKIYSCARFGTTCTKIGMI